MANNIQYAHIANVGVSSRYEETETRAYFDGTFTSSAIDTYHRIVHPSNFGSIVQQITAGVRLLDSHKHDSNGIGKTNFATIMEEQIDGSLYIFKGMKVDDTFQPMRLDSQSYPDTLSWIMGLKDGMIDKLSMGWLSERDLCKICGQDIYGYKCRHYPGERYPITNTETGEETMETCVYECYDITVVEMSLVYFGANPDARLVAKAKAMADTFTNEQIDRIESQLKVAIIDTHKEYSMPIDAETKKEIAEAVKTAMAETKPEKTAAPAPTADDSLNVTDANGNVVRTMKRSELPQPPVPLTETAVVEAVKGAIAPLTERLDKIEVAVKSGDSLNEREEAIAENVKQNNRIHGKDADEEAHKALLETFPNVEAIQAHTASLKKTADTLFHAGRQTDGLGTELHEGSGEGNEADPSAANPM